MPELPEVETVRSELDLLLRGAEIEKVSVRRRDLRVPVPSRFARALKGQKIECVRRRAKYLLIQTSGPTILSHLGMSGSWRWIQDGGTKTHDHCFIQLKDGRMMAYNDPRRFGLLDLLDLNQLETSRWLKHLGPEPLEPSEFHAEYLYERSRGVKTSLKNFIMDQKNVVGVGNIYACEALFKAGLKPDRRAGRLSRSDCQALIDAITSTLREAIAAKGTTLRDFQQVNGESGYFQGRLLVYGRKGEPCVHCSHHVRMKVIGGRSTFWCAVCQK